ncbi:MAG: BMP family ABC transporter substrate-binding protein [Actinomycetota bacterium]|jgi:basic membrane protein A and related proteins|nr:BMP family ABC transporter substrate-binding protein [Actinomycetota bacterium]
MSDHSNKQKEKYRMQKKLLGRWGVIALAATLTATVVTGCGSDSEDAAENLSGTIGIAYSLGGRDVPGFNQLAYIGVEPLLAANDSLELIESQDNPTATDDQRAERLRLMAQKGANPIVVVGFTYAAALAKVAPEFPDTTWGIVDDSSVTAPNVHSIVFKEEEGSYLVGVAAALKSKSNNVGFIGGVNTPLIAKFEAGFIAGAKAVNAGIKVQSTYISNFPDFSGFNDPAKGYEAAKGMYENGADVVYAAAGGTGTGLHKAASELGKWSVGVDADEATYPAHADYVTTILTSMLKRVDVGVAAFVADALAGVDTAGVKTWGFAEGGVGYTTTGGYIDDLTSQIEEYAAKIASGDVVVPTDPKA